jgi:histidyl-tRNA synthetase
VCMSKISLNPPSGFRDFSPAETLLRQKLMETIGLVYRQYGFAPISVSHFENLAVLQGKGGGNDNEKLIFKVLRRGDDLKAALEKGTELSDMGLRFDLTLPLARYYAAQRNDLPKPFKVYHMAPVWRADRPQKGRYREFYQCDVDVLGSADIGAEIECLSAILAVFLKVELPDIELVLNDRRLLTALGNSIGVDAQVWQQVLVALDKLDKIGPEGVEKEITAKNLLSPSDWARVSALVLGEASLELWSSLNADACTALAQILQILRTNFAGLKISFLPSLVRGQDYYTGTIFEIRHKELSGSLGGGGRYDRLLEMFQGESVAAFGGSIGFERLCLLLAERQSLVSDGLSPQVFLPLFSEPLRAKVCILAQQLRARGLRVDVFPDASKLKNQFKYADDRKIPFTVLLGEDEDKNGIVKLKHMESRQEETLLQSDLMLRMENLCK